MTSNINARAAFGSIMRTIGVASIVLVSVASQVMAGETNSSSGYERGLVNMNSKEWKEAILNFTDAIRLNPRDALAYEARGGAHFAMDDLDKAINDFTQAIQLAPANDRLFYNRSAAYRAKREFDKAISDLSDTLRLNPTCELAWKCRADSHSEKGDFDKAINDWNEGLRLNPNDAQALGTRGHAYFMTSQFNKAVKDYRDAIRLDPQNDKAYNNFGWLRATCPAAEMRNGKEAVELATKACELTKWEKWDWIDTLAAAFAEAGDFKNAVKFQKQAMDMSNLTEPYRKEMQRCLLLYEQEKPNHDGQKQ